MTGINVRSYVADHEHFLVPVYVNANIREYGEKNNLLPKMLHFQ